MESLDPATRITDELVKDSLVERKRSLPAALPVPE